MLSKPDNKSREANIIGLEALFALFSVLNVLVLHYIFATVVPFPLVGTWFQLLIGFLYTNVLGEFGMENKNWNQITPTRISKEKVAELFIPTIAFLTMLTSGNILLSRIPSVGCYPVVVSFAIVGHHAARFFGCGQIYRPNRWIALGIILCGYLLSWFDGAALGSNIGFISIVFGLSTAIYRAAFLERSLHITRGLATELFQHQAVIGICLMPVVILLSTERRFFWYMPTDFAKVWTWLMWGCLSTAAALPLFKNVVSNALIRYSGQPPWRFLELLAISAVFFIGWTVFGRITALSIISFVLVFTGRTVNTLDALSLEADAAGQEAVYQYSGPAAAPLNPPQPAESTPSPVAPPANFHDIESAQPAPAPLA